ncbi:FeoA family protein [Colwellia psychrerythraea]|uniref:FeoA family protein n=1 Tax=Colwellia psychrerythraea TaxID=28229 RepID=A0A099KXS7_COLPS|nr:FeoA family protein [Colwellia psychrerythraea]KGJ94985.1 FeoA family protein [Colwellia psychrerythraea]
MTLAELPLNKLAKISVLPKDEAIAAQLIEQGFTLRSHISLAHKAPFKGPMAFRLHNTKISIQRAIAEQIGVSL